MTEATSQHEPDASITHAPDAVTGTKVVAVFDVDRTLVHKTTTERIYIRYLVRKGIISPLTMARTGLLILRKLPRSSPFETVRANRVFLAGIKADVTRDHARRIFQTHILPRIGPEAVAAVEWHHQQGHAVALLSGSLDFLLEPLREHLRADYLIATRLEEDGRGKLTGRIVGLHPYGENKAVLLKELVAAHGFDLSQSYAYADHHSDVELLSLFGHPVAVNPHPLLQAHAEKHGWPIKLFPVGDDD